MRAYLGHDGTAERAAKEDDAARVNVCPVEDNVEDGLRILDEPGLGRLCVAALAVSAIAPQVN